MDDAEGGVAVTQVGDDDAHAAEVVDLVELLAVEDHLLVDRVEVLGAARDVGGDAHLAQGQLQLRLHLLHVDVVGRRPLGHHLLDLRVALRMDDGEGEVLEAPLHLLHPEAVGQGRVDVEGLLGDAPLLPLGERGDGLHVVEAVGQLDDEDADVLRHGDDHLAQRGRLLLFLGDEVEAVELGDAVDQVGDLVVEGLAEVGDVDVGRVLDGVVEQGGGHGGRVEAEAGDDAGHPDGVDDVGIARLAPLAFVEAGGRLEGLLEEARVGLRMVLAEGPQHGLPRRVDLIGSSVGLAPAGEHGEDAAALLVCHAAIIPPAPSRPEWRGHPGSARAPTVTFSRR